jgi:MerR family transcriptional regulator/heat shock protein HspR
MKAHRPEFYLISVAARELGMHPQTLRKYERLGLVQPTRMSGAVRVYTAVEIDRLRLVKHLVDEVGVNLAGVRRLIAVAEAVARLRPLLARATSDGRRRRLARELDQVCAMLGL